MTDAARPAPPVPVPAEAKAPEQLRDIERLMSAAAKNKASDLHLKVGQKPIFRINTQLHEVGNRPLTAEDVRKWVFEIMSEEQRERFDKEMDLDFAYSLNGVGRFRMNVFHERGCVAVAARRVNTSIPSFEELHVPPTLEKLCDYEQGLIIVAGPTGSGKSTTLACIIDNINS